MGLAASVRPGEVARPETHHAVFLKVVSLAVPMASCVLSRPSTEAWTRLFLISHLTQVVHPALVPDRGLSGLKRLGSKIVSSLVFIRHLAGSKDEPVMSASLLLMISAGWLTSRSRIAACPSKQCPACGATCVAGLDRAPRSRLHVPLDITKKSS